MIKGIALGHRASGFTSPDSPAPNAVGVFSMNEILMGVAQ